ncbi:MAG: GIY-YIG nuclease family protein [Nitrospirae bacterium]|nr:GIY-YIG nuclease family protein [Nitrospirota bacterium]
MPYFVYVLRSLKDGRFYIGSTRDVQARLAFRNAGLQRSTWHRTPFELAYMEEHPVRTEALRRERQLKRMKGGEGLRRILERV